MPEIQEIGLFIYLSKTSGPIQPLYILAGIQVTAAFFFLNLTFGRKQKQNKTKFIITLLVSVLLHRFCSLISFISFYFLLFQCSDNYVVRQRYHKHL